MMMESINDDLIGASFKLKINQWYMLQCSSLNQIKIKEEYTITDNTYRLPLMNIV
jgi:hypothetical protein